eukprot:symbB.v1.2.029573.t1/scaffold3253.1/size60181/1
MFQHCISAVLASKVDLASLHANQCKDGWGHPSLLLPSNASRMQHACFVAIFQASLKLSSIKLSAINTSF